ncbi:MAG: response regulator [Anaerolineaceae bacterium]|nr:response regulator [Anaerolineaceae bacterium]
MIWQQTPYTFPLFATAILTLTAALYAYRQRHVPGALHMYHMMAAVTFWVVFYALELNTVSLAGKLFWARLQYLGIVYVAVGYFLFVLHYIGEFHRFKRPRPFLLALHVLPGITLLLAWTSSWHPWLWRATRLVSANGLSFLQLDHGFWFWVFVGYVYLLLTASTLLLLRKITTVAPHFRGQIVLTIIGSLFPWLGNLLYILNSSSGYLDFTLFGFSVTAVCFMLALFHFSFLDLLPLAQGLVIEKLESGVIVVDGQNRIIRLNNTAAALLEAENISLGASLVPQEAAWAGVTAILQTNQPGKTQLTLNEAVYEVTVTLLDSLSGQANGRLITLHNITRQKNTELLLEHAKEAAAAADQAKSNFLTNMSHEIRTPLNAVVGLAEMLRQTQLNANQREMIEMMAQSSNNLMLLINNILDFAKLEAGNLTLNQQAFDLIDCLEAALDSVRPAAQDKQLQLSYQIDAATPTALVGDPVRLRQVLVNLLENGIKFTETGDVEIHIDHPQEQTPGLLQFVVKDTGIGIAADQIEKLFMPFQQVDGSMTRQYGGNGLGLVVCQRLVTLMGGSIYLNSTLGQGTAVHFTAQFNVTPEDKTPEITLRHHQATLVNKRLLVITNDAARRRHISKEARVAGLEVYAAGSSHEASYWIAHSQPFDVVLLDTAVWQEEPIIVTQLRRPDADTLLPIILLNPDGPGLPAAAAPGAFVGSLALPVATAQLYDVLMNVLAVGQSPEAAANITTHMANRLPLQILVVEDNELNQRILKNLVGKLGYQPDIAENGQIAVDMAAQTDYDVILMDIQMPVMDGVAATHHIRANTAEGKRPYIVAVTAHTLEGDREYYLSSGMDAYLSKPVTLNQLVETLYQSRGRLAEQVTPTRLKIPAADVSRAETDRVPSGEPGGPIDFAELALLIEGDPMAFLKTMAPIFLQDTQKVLNTLSQAVQNGDTDAIKMAAHSLKGTSASMGCKRLSQQCRELEMMARADNLAEAPPQLQKIIEEYGRIHLYLANESETAV